MTSSVYAAFSDFSKLGPVRDSLALNFVEISQVEVELRSDWLRELVSQVRAESLSFLISQLIDLVRRWVA